MKKTLIIAGVLGAFATAAHAQSSVTLYGSLDAGIIYVNNAGGAHGNWFMGSGALSNNFFGLRGTEDLGNGNHAIFDLEEGFNVNNGATSGGNFLNGGSGMFTRQAWVGLQNDRAGTVKLGRQFDAVYDYLTPFALAGQAGGVNLAGHPYNNDNISGQYSFANTIKYSSPLWSGNWGSFDFGATYSFSNSSSFNINRAWSVGANYTWGPLKVGAAYDQLNAGGATAGGTLSSDAPGVFGADVQRTYGVGVNYSYAIAGHGGTVGVLWTHSKSEGSDFFTAGNSPRFDNIELNGTFGITPALAVVGDYTYTWGKGMTGDNGTAKWHSVTLALDYSLSKRTDVYLAGVYQHASGDVATDLNDGSYYNPAGIAGLVPAADSSNQVGAAVGIRHRF